MRAERGKGLPDWPSWCYAPMAAAIAVVTHGMPGPALTEIHREAVIRASQGDNGALLRLLTVYADAEVIAALAAWRMGKGIYRFDENLAAALWHTPIEGALPADVLLRLPEWGAYIEVPGSLQQTPAGRIYGAFVHYEYDVSADVKGRDRRELRLLLDLDDAQIAVPIILSGTLEDGIQAVVRNGEANIARSLGQTIGPVPGQEAGLIAPIVGPLVSLALYLCSDDADIQGPPPGNPQPRRVKGGLRIFARDAPRTWDVGWRVGAALRRASQAHEGSATGAHHQGPRPHLRRAHWHHYWVGPKADGQKLIVRWLHPVLVGESDAMPAIIHPVKPATAPGGSATER